MNTSSAEMKVRGYHLDLYGHVNNARYLEILEDARWDYFENRFDWDVFKSNNWAFVVVNININYRRPAFLGDILATSTSPISSGGSSVKVKQVVRRKGTDTVIVDAEIVFVVLNQTTNKSVPMEGELRKMIFGK